MVKSMHMFIQRAPAAIFACTFDKDTIIVVGTWGEGGGAPAIIWKGVQHIL